MKMCMKLFLVLIVSIFSLGYSPNVQAKGVTSTPFRTVSPQWRSLPKSTPTFIPLYIPHKTNSLHKSSERSNRLLDENNVLSQSDYKTILSKIRAFEKSTTDKPQLVVLFNETVEDIRDFSNKKFKELGIGSKDKNNGILVVITPEKVRIEVGYGLEGVLPDGVISDILFDNKQNLVNKSYVEFINNLTNSLSTKINIETSKETVSTDSDGGMFLLILCGVLIIGGYIMFRFFKRKPPQEEVKTTPPAIQNSRDKLYPPPRTRPTQSYTPTPTPTPTRYYRQTDSDTSSFVSGVVLGSVISSLLSSSDSSDSSSSYESDSSYGGGDGGGGGSDSGSWD